MQIETLLGKSSVYKNTYDKTLLQPISRNLNRSTLNNLHAMHGFDIWNAYEVSWLNPKGKPEVAIAEFIFDANSPNIIESKSLKLYLNSFNNTKFLQLTDVQKTIQTDLCEYSSSNVLVKIYPLAEAQVRLANKLSGFNLDVLDIDIEKYDLDSSYLKNSSDEIIQEELCSNLLKSNCLVTNQPDWGSVYIKYEGPAICHQGLLRYIISFRDHQEFHEHCADRIFQDIFSICKPNSLTIKTFFTRRGGLDINSTRSSINIKPNEKNKIRLVRQ